jgi:hypothetical protein
VFESSLIETRIRQLDVAFVVSAASTLYQRFCKHATGCRVPILRPPILRTDLEDIVKK